MWICRSYIYVDVTFTLYNDTLYARTSDLFKATKLPPLVLLHRCGVESSRAFAERGKTKLYVCVYTLSLKRRVPQKI